MPGRYIRLAEAVDGTLIEGFGGCFCRVSTVYPFGFAFGDSKLGPLDPDTPVAHSAFAADEIDGTAALSDLLFFDLETTGLGGAGTVPFLVGCGSLVPGGFEVRQYLLPDYEDEAGLLEHFLNEFHDRTTLVTYNGAAFDLNVWRDRMIINRVGRKLPTDSHIDLLHSARRLYRRRLESCTLVNVEREVFGFYREGDIPGYLIPSVYFDWLGSEEVGQLPTVLEHNRWDILAMYFLLLTVSEAFVTEGESLTHTDDVYSLSRVYGRRKDTKRVIDLHRRLDEETGATLSADVLLYHSLALKRAGDWGGAVRLWQRLSGMEAAEAFDASIELAKYYEHKSEDLAAAYEHARTAERLGARGISRSRDLQKRLSRLLSKL
ncbi:MAG: ribonuclease H-like domain-containing protein [candidate division Zixibacteria bacterium]|nr:ribonuclease H-like domain-containing protein [candidate division Zixibacteria bacterium]